ncbi:PREDICTED: mitochondrial import inner membrane translocase subunit Tim10 isoform X1 [Capra hircus]|uniref:mitochondrial import inner membrane translocase subunit Tim10 isoform X1 n=1 Tax=Capra hircus TaxID=9925 RepID=UPI000846342B|nr:PREDICTED: mitochondrial import inner membrane translocase subunit Tim10 isoform X1 [Capra hircus]
MHACPVAELCLTLSHLLDCSRPGSSVMGFPRMTSACHRKCVPPHYKEAELSKGESVCLDRCVSKYLDIHERMGKKLTELSMQDEELMKRAQQSSGPV